MIKRELTAGLISLALICSANAGPGQGIHSGPWTLNPYADVSGTYDSNVGKTSTHEKEDVFADSTVGLRAGYSSYMLEFNGLGFLSQRYYSDTTENNFGAGGDLLRAKYGNRDGVEIEVDQAFRRVEDADRYGNGAAVGGVSPDSVLDVSSLSRRDINQAGISVGRNMTDKLDLDAGYRFDDINYEDASLYDLQNHIGQVETAHQLTDKTSGLLTLKAAIQNNTTQDTQAEYYAGRVGLKTRGTDKVTFKGGAGVKQYDQANGDSKTGFNFDLVSSWAVTQKMMLQAGGRNGSQMSSLYSDNGTDYQIYWVGGSLQATPSIVTSMSGAYRVDDYMNPVKDNNRTMDRKDKGVAVRVRADYQAPAKFLKIYTEASFENMDSNVEDYKDTRIAMGAILSY